MEENQKEEEILPGFSNIQDYIKHGYQIVLEATKASNALPTQREWDFYKTYDSFNKILADEGDKVLRLMNKILHNHDQNVNMRNKDIEEQTEILIEANDNILEKVALQIDELNGINKSAIKANEMKIVSARLPVNGSWNQSDKLKFSIDNGKNSNSDSLKLLTAKNIIRPQSFFKDKIDNSNGPWIPRIKEKPNSIKPLAIFLEETEFGEMYSHPYEMELEHFTPFADQLKKATPVHPKKLEETPLIDVSTPEELDKLVEDLRQHTEIGIDLEHHSYRTFMGITCLLQISTKDKDYLIDTFTLRDKLCILNEIFTKPSIVKIFHGADQDIQWLQRDLSLYVVNMFDTYQAAKQLGYPGLSLAFLLNKFCNVVPNKHFQLADWRIRPLMDELKCYAQMDTHYLIYVYHMLKNELLKKGNGSDNILKSVIHQSTEICKKRYVKPILTEDSYMEFYHKCKRLFDNRQLYALKELYKWRDRLGRSEDESTGYVLPNHMLLQISEQLPREMQGILACCNPIPPLVRANLLELHHIILKAREQSSVKPILREDNRERGSTIQLTKFNIDSPLHCPHDLSKSSEFRDDLPTVLGTLEITNACDDILNKHLAIEMTESKYSVFNTPEMSEVQENEAVSKIRKVSFLAPYQRYELIKPYIKEEEEKTALENNCQDNDISNEDRIAALHEHFVKVVKQTSQNKPDQEMKQENAEDTSEEMKQENVEDTSQGSVLVESVASVSYQTSLRSMCGARKRKRQQDDSDDDEVDSHSNKINQFTTSVPNWREEKINNPRKKKKKVKQRYGLKKFTGTQNLEDYDAGLGSSNPNKNKSRNKKKQGNRNMQKKNQKQNDRQNFKPFDYSSVNFQQFQGGASKPNNKKESIMTKFKFKNKKKKNNNFNNKSMTYNPQN